MVIVLLPTTVTTRIKQTAKQGKSDFQYAYIDHPPACKDKPYTQRLTSMANSNTNSADQSPPRSPEDTMRANSPNQSPLHLPEDTPRLALKRRTCLTISRTLQQNFPITVKHLTDKDQIMLGFLITKHLDQFPDERIEAEAEFMINNPASIARSILHKCLEDALECEDPDASDEVRWLRDAKGFDELLMERDAEMGVGVMDGKVVFGPKRPEDLGVEDVGGEDMGGEDVQAKDVEAKDVEAEDVQAKDVEATDGEEWRLFVQD